MHAVPSSSFSPRAQNKGLAVVAICYHGTTVNFAARNGLQARAGCFADTPPLCQGQIGRFWENSDRTIRAAVKHAAAGGGGLVHAAASASRRFCRRVLQQGSSRTWIGYRARASLVGLDMTILGTAHHRRAHNHTGRTVSTVGAMPQWAASGFCRTLTTSSLCGHGVMEKSRSALRLPYLS